ncbi:hypothetical protein F441_09341, partial [Phytophthora nicotianae CJ01A1]
ASISVPSISQQARAHYPTSLASSMNIPPSFYLNDYSKKRVSAAHQFMI